MASINGITYNWSNLTVNVDGTSITGITAITYKEDQTIDNVYGAGTQPIGRSYGKVTPTASITLLLEEVEKIRAKSPTGRLQDAPVFDIIVMYGDTSKGQKIVTHRLRNAQIKNNGQTAKASDSNSYEVELELVISGIEWQ